MNYVKICDAYGTGFFYIPGTDTCLKIGGRVRFEVGYITSGNIMLPPVVGNGNVAPNANAAGMVNAAGATSARPMSFVSGSSIDTTGTHVRGIVQLDARTPTALGTVRTNIWIRAVNESGVFPSNYIRGNYNGGNSTSLTVENTYVQWAGFTAGRARENFTFMPGTGYVFTRRAGFASGIPQLTYTHSFGGGWSATLSMEDWTGLNSASSAHSLGGITGTPFQRAGVMATLAPMRMPAFVGNVRVDQSWGSAQVMGAVVQNRALLSAPAVFAAPGATTTTITKTGYALGAGLKINLPILAAGDEFWFQGAYAKGAFDWIISNNTSAQTSDHGHQLPGLQRIDRNMTIFGVGGNAAGGIVGVGAELNTAWQLAASFQHYWTPTIRSVINASYINITPGAQTRNTDWSLGGMSKASGYNLASALMWTPVKDFELGVEVGYAKLNQSLTGTNGAAPSALGLPAGFTQPKINPNVWLLRGRVERNF